MKLAGLCWGVAASLCVLLAAGSEAQAQGTAAAGGVGEGTPFASEARVLVLKHHWTRERVEVTYKIGAVYQPEAMAQINHFMRDWHCDKIVTIDPKLIDLLYDLRQEFGGRTLTVLSAYRSEGYNASLLRAGRGVEPNSQHMLGHAVDLYIPGVRGDTLRQAALKRGVGGVGYYPFSGPTFVHVDTGPVRQWIETDPKVRRAMRKGVIARGRLKVDCALTMPAALESLKQAEAAAATKIAARTSAASETAVANPVPVPVASPVRAQKGAAVRGMARSRRQVAAVRRLPHRRGKRFVWRRAVRQTPRDFLPQL